MKVRCGCGFGAEKAELSSLRTQSVRESERGAALSDVSVRE